MDIQKNQTQESFEKLYVKNAPDWSLERDQDGGYKYHATQSAFVLFENQQLEIESLKSELVKAQAESKLISVNDQMPEGNILVLAMSQTVSNIFNVYNVMALDEFEESDITHWMPLPDSPQEPTND